MREVIGRWGGGLDMQLAKVCAWCSEWIEPPAIPGAARVSHGICESCSHKLAPTSGREQ